MAVAAAPAPPTLAAARPQVVHARPLTAQRAHLAPANRRQAPARLREAPAAHKQMCTFYSWAHSHAQHLAHFLATHVHARSTAAARRRQQQQRQRRQRRQRQRQQSRRELLQWFSVAALSHGKAEALAAESGQPCRSLDGCHCRQSGFALDLRQLRRSAVPSSTAVASASRVSLFSRSSQWQFLCAICVLCQCCLACQTHILATSRSALAAVISDS